MLLLEVKVKCSSYSAAAQLWLTEHINQAFLLRCAVTAETHNALHNIAAASYICRRTLMETVT